MFGKVWKWAGAYRTSNTSIGIKPSLIPYRLVEMCHEVNSWLQYPVDLTFLEMAARVHHRLVFIHPFENGNGRFSRLIADRFLLFFKCSYPMWPGLLHKEGSSRKDYIQTLKSANKGDYEPLISFMESLGAKDPNLEDVIKSKFYRKQLSKEGGIFMVKALLRRSRRLDEGQAIHLAEKEGLRKVVELLKQS